jgi:hypothetical protein
MDAVLQDDERNGRMYTVVLYRMRRLQPCINTFVIGKELFYLIKTWIA